ncbi:MAG: hypothetical protein J0H39_13980 [Alphaproteobacteria bacterium]|nr:hypothetical protein [Alphaproteobacteria bacterium]
MVKLHNVPTADAERAWPLVRAHIERTAETSAGEMTADDIKARIASGDFQLWIVLDGADLLATVLTEVVSYPQRKVCFIVGCVGEHRVKWIHLIAEIEDWARLQGCATSRIRARKGWVKVLPDYKIAHIVLERAL